MKYGLLIVIAVAVLSGCFGKEEVTTSTVPVTTLPIETTTPVETTITETTVERPLYEKCEDMGPLEKDLCYFGIAVNTNNMSLCEAISTEFRREFCLNNTGVEVGGNSTMIDGQVVNKYTGKGYSDVLVELYSSLNSTVPIAFDKADAQGYYHFEVPGGDTYDVVVYIEDSKLKQTVKDARRNNRYIVDFVIR